MNEGVPANENDVEKFPNEREILNLFEEIIEGDFEIYRSLKDEQGLLYMLEVRGIDEDGDIIQYNYIRAGSYPEGSSSETVIDVIYFMGDTECGGDCVAKFKNGNWVKLFNTASTEANSEPLDSEQEREALEAQYEELKKLENEHWDEFESARAAVVSELGYEVVINQGRWLVLIKNGHTISLKHNESGGEYGYKKGKIIMCMIHEGESRGLFKPGDTEEVVVFDKGLMPHSPNSTQKELFDELVSALN